MRLRTNSGTHPGPVRCSHLYLGSVIPAPFFVKIVVFSSDPVTLPIYVIWRGQKLIIAYRHIIFDNTTTPPCSPFFIIYCSTSPTTPLHHSTTTPYMTLTVIPYVVLHQPQHIAVVKLSKPTLITAALMFCAFIIYLVVIKVKTTSTNFSVWSRTFCWCWLCT